MALRFLRGLLSGPAQFSFTPVSGAPISTLETSNTITLSGFAGSVAISVSGGQYSKNGGAYTSSAGTAVATDTIGLQQTSSGSNSTETDTVFTAGTTSATWRVTTTSGAGVPLLAPTGSWSGTPGTGFAGTFPTDPTRTTAKPMLRMATAWGQRISGSTFRIFVDADCAGDGTGSVFGLASVNGYLEGSSGAGSFAKYTYTDPNGNSVAIQCYAFDVDVAACVAAHGTGGVDFYAEAIPNDTSMQKRVIGPFRFYPRATQYSGQYDVGVGQTYATRKLALTAAVANNEEAPLLLYHTTAFYEAEDCSGITYTGLKGFITERAVGGVTATIRRAAFPTGLDDLDTGCFWDPGPDGIEWGPGIVLDPRNWSYINNRNQTYADGLKHGHRLNGCNLINSEGTLDSYYWNGRPRYAGLWSTIGFIEDCTVQFLIAGISDSYLTRNVQLHGNLRECAQDSYYLNKVYLNGWDANNFWFQTSVMHLSYSNGAHVGKMWVTNFENSTAQMHFSVDDVEEAWSPISLGWLSNQANFSTTQVVATINGHSGAGWAASVITDGPSACWMAGINLAPDHDAGSAPTVVGGPGSPSLVRASYDFHQDFFHDTSQTTQHLPYTTAPNEGTILRDVTVIGETVQPQNLTVPAFIRAGFGFKDLALIDCSLRMCFVDDRTATNMSHTLMRGCAWAREGWTPNSTAYDKYSRFEASIDSVFWAAGTITWPAFVNCYIAQSNGSDVTSALAGSQHHGNHVVPATDFNSMIAATRALFVNVDVADFRPAPAGNLPNFLVTRTEPMDAACNIFAVPDVIGSMASGQSARTWPF